MKAAKEVAAGSKVWEFKLGAIIVLKGKVVASGVNEYRTHPKFGSGYHNRLHAEGGAIYNSVRQGIDLEGATLYVYRLPTGRTAKPCLSCEQMLRDHKIRRVVFSAIGYEHGIDGSAT